jgi:hypothetical protein
MAKFSEKYLLRWLAISVVAFIAQLYLWSWIVYNFDWAWWSLPTIIVGAVAFAFNFASIAAAVENIKKL